MFDPKLDITNYIEYIEKIDKVEIPISFEWAVERI